MAGLQPVDVDTFAAQSEVLKHSNEKALDEKSFVDSSEEANDGIHDGLVFPTEEERLTLRRVSDRIPWNAYRASTFPRRVCPFLLIAEQ
jgi:POT family proton-dependent oligopeptide transporter